MLARERQRSQLDYGQGTLYAIGTAVLLAVQEPFSALAARTLTSLDFIALTQVALLLSLPLLLSRADSRRDFAAILLDARQWPKLAVIFLVGVAGLELYDVGLSSAHPIITAGVLNLSPFWAALVAFVVSRRSISVSPAAFWPCFFVAFCGAMAIAWSQIDIGSRLLTRDVIASLLHSRWIYALPMPAFFALSGTLVFKWFPDFDEAASIGANFFVSAAILIPAATIRAHFQPAFSLSEQAAGAIGLLLLGTLAASAAGRLLYQKALTATRDDNGYVTMFFLMIPGLSSLISWPLSGWIPTLRFIPSPAFGLGLSLVMGPLVLLSAVSRRGRKVEPAPSSFEAMGAE